MLFGDSGSCVHAAQWIVLYRRADQSFSELDRQYLLALWPHIKQASAINRRHCLDWHARSRNTRAAALANQHGVIEAAHPYFRDLLCLEWPDFTSNRLPDALTESWRQGRAYIGSRIRVAMHMEEELLVCVAMQVAMPPPLTQAERIVASQFAEGASYKAIAEQLCVSQHTIRSHIAHIYAKLDVHDKAALANKLNQGLDAGLNQDT
jgi:DNA-binding CsgD family transcriptional regulator